ncbi:MAG TPA: 30S ribosomal protein S6 [Candidatus Saccharimonadales bacterium]|nr:30S ribosomal protein S6 [Candidatus Saccharimonadales bacterium]
MPKAKTAIEEPVVEIPQVRGHQLYLISILTQEESALDEFVQTVEKAGGVIKKSESLGRKTLAYSINKHPELILMSIFCELDSDQVKPLEQTLKHEDYIERYLLTKWDAELPVPHHHQSRPTHGRMNEEKENV